MEILLFAGTTEGRELTEYILAKGGDVNLTVSSATQYGSSLLPAGDERLKVIFGRLDREDIAALIREDGYDLVIDATHPHAELVSRNISDACRDTKARRLRVIREEAEGSQDTDAVFVTDITEAAAFLSATQGNIFSAVGVKGLPALTAIRDFEKRVYVRIIPDEDNLRSARALGFLPSHIICMQGPFGQELNRALFEELSIRYLLTKESGASGGYGEKLAAASKAHVNAVVIKRPDSAKEGLSLEAAKAYISALISTEKSERQTQGGAREREGVWCSQPLTGGGMKRGVTTGSCAALAAKAAAFMALTQKKRELETLITPKGLTVTARICDIDIQKGDAACSVRKYSGDDPDITNGAMIRAEVSLSSSSGISIEGGEGIGVVTKPGLAVEVGRKAINPVPERMIEEAVRSVFEEYEYDGGARVVISVPDGAALAAKTFNPRIGIEGGISILGTTGVIEPMSNEAFIEATGSQLDVIRASGSDEVILTPGSIGESFAVNTLGLERDLIAQYGNFIGATADLVVKKGFSRLHLVGHLGKLVKIAAGVMDTRSLMADCRMETLAAHTALAGGDSATVRQIMESVTTDEAVRHINELGLLEAVMDAVMSRISYHLGFRMRGSVEIKITVFTGRDDSPGGRVWFTL